MMADTIAGLQETLRRERGLMAQRRADWKAERERLEARIAEQEALLALIASHIAHHQFHELQSKLKDKG